MHYTWMLGFILFLLVLLVSIYEHISSFLRLDSFLIVFLGSFSASLVHFPFKNWGLLLNSFSILFKKEISHDSKVFYLISFSEKLNSLSTRELIEDLDKCDDFFLRKSLLFVIEGLAINEIKDYMEDYIDYMEERHNLCIEFFDEFGKYAPGFGLIGTIIGFTVLLKNLEDLQTLSQGVSIAFITTFYGVLISYVFCSPISGRLYTYSKDEIRLRKLLLAGILLIAERKSTYELKEKLMLLVSEKKQNTYLNFKIQQEKKDGNKT